MFDKIYTVLVCLLIIAFMVGTLILAILASGNN